jgi:hypothetical protein
MSKKLPTITASVVAFVFVFLSVAHACPSLTSTNSVIRKTAMNMAVSDSSPCGEAKPDVCKSVRDSMLSVKPPTTGLDSLVKTFSASPISFVSSSLLGSSPVTSATIVTSHLVFKLPLSSYLVLRI